VNAPAAANLANIMSLRLMTSGARPAAAAAMNFRSTAMNGTSTQTTSTPGCSASNAATRDSM
jgi:hypothetical protein